MMRGLIKSFENIEQRYQPKASGTLCLFPVMKIHSRPGAGVNTQQYQMHTFS